MDLAALIAEGEALARSASLLVPSSALTPTSAYWRGECQHSPLPSGASKMGSRRHIVTVDSALFGDLPVRSCEAVSVFEYETATGDLQYRIETVTDLAFHEIRCSGEPLSARPFRCPPPFAAVCLYGSDRVEAWMASQGLERFEYAALETSPLATAYMAEFMSRHPLYLNNCTAMIRGWHVSWPEDAFYRPLEVRLALFTFRDAQPWLEVWADQNLNLDVIPRIA